MSFFPGYGSYNGALTNPLAGLEGATLRQGKKEEKRRKGGKEGTEKKGENAASQNIISSYGLGTLFMQISYLESRPPPAAFNAFQCSWSSILRKLYDHDQSGDTCAGVVEEENDEDGASTKLASSVWYDMRNNEHLRNDIDITFTRVRPRHDVTVDNVIECTYKQSHNTI